MIPLRLDSGVYPLGVVLIDAYPGTSDVRQGTTVVLVCRVVGAPSSAVLRYEWTCAGQEDNGRCDSRTPPEVSKMYQIVNVLVVNVVRSSIDDGEYTCTVKDQNNDMVGSTAGHNLRVVAGMIACH